jgi:hypothetical protein
MMLKRGILALMLGLLLAGSAATAGTSGKPVTWQFDFGYSMVQGKPGDVFKDGYTLGFGAVVRTFPKAPLAWRFDMTYDWWDVNKNGIPDYGISVDDGDANQWALRSGIQYEAHGDKVKFAGGLGIGGYRLHANLTEEVLVPGWICDPYWYWLCYPGLIPGDLILADNTLTKFGYYATAAIVIPLDHSDFFIEAQYHWVNVENYYQTLPINIGWRF